MSQACFVGVEFEHDRSEKKMFIHHFPYASKVLKKFRMEYKYLESDDAGHWNAIKMIIKYVPGSIDLGIVYRSTGDNFVLTGFTDSCFSGDVNTRRSTPGCASFLCDGVVTWCC